MVQCGRGGTKIRKEASRFLARLPDATEHVANEDSPSSLIFRGVDLTLRNKEKT